MTRILLITPPFTQLNTPYPATAYLKGFLNTLEISSYQVDLGIEVILRLFSKEGLKEVFALADQIEYEISENAERILALREDYLSTINAVITFLQNKNPTLAHSIVDRQFLPEASRFAELEDLDWAFGTMGIQDRAKHLATLYLEDLGDLITELIDPHFGFSRYAERLGRAASHFDELQKEVEARNSIVSDLLEKLLEEKIQEFQPTVIGLSVPFPGNLFAAFKIGQYVKRKYPGIKIILGGGFANTELRSLGDERVFEYLDYVCLDDGEAPLKILLEYLEGKREVAELKRVFHLYHGVVQYGNGAVELDVPQRETGTPDFGDLLLDQYLSVIEVVNPMHRLWSDGRWNKLTLAHGCYWGKCSFCDVTLDYIQRYEPISAEILCDRIETIIEQTGVNGFHFVDEAAPPALMRDLAVEIIRRKLTVVWWTNIRFEKSFTKDLCRLLRASGCIAVSGGLEVASDRLLALMKKGVTVAQVARVADAFTQSGIMVHAYLMYGFPTQTAQETIDSLEMVRQLFEAGVIQSGFWHRFAMTAHSPVGVNPKAYEVELIGPQFGGFAENDLYHDDPNGADHDIFSEGLKKSLFNYMHGVGFEFHLSEWFDSAVPETIVKPTYIQQCLAEEEALNQNNPLVLWVGPLPEAYLLEEENRIAFLFRTKQEEWTMQVTKGIGEWMISNFESWIPSLESSPVRWKEVESTFRVLNLEDKPLEHCDWWKELRNESLLLV